jgi:hypothetical protein
MQDNNSTAHHSSSPQEGSLPFFARFLEGQNDEERSAATRKYPSDVDEYVTMKYPSDDDEAGDTFAARDSSSAGSERLAQTLKYPSDRDEWEPYSNSERLAQTLKYPSDRDEWDGYSNS